MNPVRHDPTSPSGFAALVDFIDQPPVTVDGRLLQGRDGWNWFHARASRGDRVRLLSRLHNRLLVATAPGRVKLRGWLTDGRLPPIPAAELADWIRQRLAFFGDRALLDTTVGALLTVPEPVREAVIRDAAFVAVGVDTRAWIISNNFSSIDGAQKAHLIALSATTDASVIRHEIAHSWHRSTARWPAIGAVGEEGLVAFAEYAGMTERMTDNERSHELLANGLAHVWSTR